MFQNYKLVQVPDTPHTIILENSMTNILEENIPDLKHLTRHLYNLESKYKTKFQKYKSIQTLKISTMN